MKTLNQFIDNCGSQEQAANKLGVPLHTLWRWVHRKARISPAWEKLLKSKGVYIGENNT